MPAQQSSLRFEGAFLQLQGAGYRLHVTGSETGGVASIDVVAADFEPIAVGCSQRITVFDD